MEINKNKKKIVEDITIFITFVRSNSKYLKPC